MDRTEAWVTASKLVQPIVNEYELEDYPVGPMFTASTNTKVDQHINHIMNVADWLLGVE